MGAPELKDKLDGRKETVLDESSLKRSNVSCAAVVSEDSGRDMGVSALDVGNGVGCDVGGQKEIEEGVRGGNDGELGEATLSRESRKRENLVRDRPGKVLNSNHNSTNET